ncbi:hypothetical protein GGS24DRAFT_653 [Hypoxylon argillaceum]|nr:hypothetical protein GGS24DRAFT_653 [Hypoxylon argillaceum]
MKFNDLLLPALMAASPCYAGPVPMLDLALVNSPETDLLVREGINLARSLDLAKRASADFSLEKSWNNEVLFGGAWNNTDPGSSETAELSVTCLTCFTNGTVTAAVTDKSFLNPVLRLSFSGVEAYASLGVAVSASQTFSINLFSSDTPIGIGITGLDVGVVFFVDLVFSLSEAIDLSAGFSVSVPDDAFLEADIFKGDIDDSSFGGLNSQYLPVTVVSGHATFKADLRLRVQAGAEASLDIFGIGAGAVVGIYANLIEFVADIEKTDTCELEAGISWDLNVGAFAHLDIVVDYTTLGPVPTVSTTLLIGSGISTCLVGAATTTTALALPATTSEIATSEIAVSTPASSLPAATLIGTAVVAEVAATTSASVTGTDLVWSPTFVLSVTVPEVSFTVADPLPTDTALTTGAASSVLPSDVSSAAVPTGVASSLLSFGASSAAPTTGLASSSSFSSDASSAAFTSAAVSPLPSSDASATPSTPVTSAAISGYSSAAVSSVGAASSAPSYTAIVGAGTYPVVPGSSVITSSAPAGGPTYTSTYTHVMTLCGAQGVMNCPSSYQTQVVVTRTTTICPVTATEVASTATTSASAPVVSSESTNSNGSGSGSGSGEVVVIVLTPLPTPVTATFVSPSGVVPVATTIYTDFAQGPSTTTATATSTATLTVLASHGGLVVPTALTVVPNQAANLPGTATFANSTAAATGTGYVPGATQSAGSPAGSSSPAIAGAGRLSAFGSANGAYVGAALTFVLALCMGAL